MRHGHKRRGFTSPTYHSWQSMKSRCNLANRHNSSSYFGKGISYDPRWELFDAFLEDMGVRPEGTTLDRKDNSLSYNKNNCRWADKDTQGRNKSTTRLDYTGAVLCVVMRLNGMQYKEIAEVMGTSENTPREVFKGRTWKGALEEGTKLRELQRAARDSS